MPCYIIKGIYLTSHLNTILKGKFIALSDQLDKCHTDLYGTKLTGLTSKFLKKILTIQMGRIVAKFGISVGLG